MLDPQIPPVLRVLILNYSNTLNGKGELSAVPDDEEKYGETSDR